MSLRGAAGSREEDREGRGRAPHVDTGANHREGLSNKHDLRRTVMKPTHTIQAMTMLVADAGVRESPTSENLFGRTSENAVKKLSEKSPKHRRAIVYERVAGLKEA
jgi:hypothetical protein